MKRFLIRRADIDDQGLHDVRLENGRIARIERGLTQLPEEVLIDAAGGALLPGLHDHHIHLLSLAAATASVFCGPPELDSLERLTLALQADSGKGWLRGVGYHESVAGLLDRWQLDQIISHRPVRIQHRSGKMWLLNSLAIETLGLDDAPAMEGLERATEGGFRGQVNGRLFRLDDWLRQRMGDADCPDPSAVSQRLASYGVTGITDTTATNSAFMSQQFAAFIDAGKLLQRVLLMGAEDLPSGSHPQVVRGALKILLDDHRLPTFDELAQRIAEAHAADRPVAIHCVTRTELIFALSALIGVGCHPGDRIEHASITPDDAIPLMREAQITVVTQPGFLYSRGEQYLRDVDPADVDILYRCQSFLDAGIPLAGSSDAPYGDPDPWLAMRAAVERKSATGQVIGAGERVSPEQALAMFISDPLSPGGPARKIAPGDVADLCLLSIPWSQARSRLYCEDVRATFRDAQLIYAKEDALPD